ncbi:MAG: pilus assembly protein [Phototrophicales bacterium]|nr:MAG: pilus assembly protein [Phototrophicales bacterium]RMG73124.1 MAG: Flp family type IVb pilin [Chloroflexota bacterium]
MLTPPQDTSQEGQGLVEYALILVLVSVAALALMMLLGPQIGNLFQNILDSMRAASGS